MLTIKMAWRNLGRNRRRTAITVMVMSFCYLFMLFMVCITRGAYSTVISNTVRTGTGHLQIHKKDFRLNGTPEYYMQLENSAFDVLKQQPMIQDYALRIKGSGLLNYTFKSQPVKIIGIQPQSEAKISIFHKQAEQNGALIAGDYLQETDWQEGYHDKSPEYKSPGIMIGCKLAQKLSVAVGNKVVLLLQDMNQEMQSTLFVIRGIFRTLDREYDLGTILVHYKTGQKLLGYDRQNYTSEIVITAKNYDCMMAVSQKLRETFLDKEYEVLTWNDIHADILEYLQVEDVFLVIVLGILLFIAMIGVTIVMLMNILERVREFGVLRAIGMNHRELCALIMWETLFLIAVSCVIGLIPGIPLCQYLENSGLNITKLSGMSDEIGYINLAISLNAKIYADFKIEYILYCFGIMSVVAILGSLYSYSRATKIEIVEALNFV